MRTTKRWTRATRDGSAQAALDATAPDLARVLPAGGRVVALRQVPGWHALIPEPAGPARARAPSLRPHFVAERQARPVDPTAPIR
jgi:hypothetical protein